MIDGRIRSFVEITRDIRVNRVFMFSSVLQYTVYTARKERRVGGSSEYMEEARPGKSPVYPRGIGAVQHLKLLKSTVKNNKHLDSTRICLGVGTA